MDVELYPPSEEAARNDIDYAHFAEPAGSQLIRKLKVAFAHPRIYTNAYSGGYSVAGALCLAYRRIRPDFQVHGFPGIMKIKGVLLSLNPELSKSRRLVERIHWLMVYNDRGEFDTAWDRLEDLLVWRDYPSPWHVKGRKHGPREPSMLEIHNKRIKFEERGVRLRFLWAMRKSQ